MRLKFLDCVFDSGTREVFRSGRPASISPKAFQFLAMLIGGRPNAVSKEQLHEHLWRTLSSPTQTCRASPQSCAPVSVTTPEAPA